MNLGPERLPSPDAETAATALGDGLRHLPTEVLSTAGGLLTSVEPHTLVLGTVVGTLCKAEVTEYSRKLDVRLQEYVEEHGDENAIAARIAAGVSRLLPDGEELNQAALQAARGDSDALRGLLEEYHTDEQRRAELDDAVERILTGDFDDVEETLTEAFDTSDADAAQALLYDFAELVRTRQVQQTLETVLELDGRFDALADDLDAMQRELEDNITQGPIEVDLQDEGFTRLSSFVFDRTVDEPEQAWRAGLGLVHVRRGYAVDRRRRDGTNVTGALFEQLRSGETPVNRIVRGPAGSGKSTVCKQGACRWYDDPETGPVFCEVVREFRGTDIDVSFLLDARRGELDEFEDPARMSRGGCRESGRTDTPRQTELYFGEPTGAVYEQVQDRQRPPPGGHVRGPG